MSLHVEQLLNRIVQLQHPLLVRYAKIASLSNMRLYLAEAMYVFCPKTIKTDDQFLAALLLQIGLDTHDLITESDVLHLEQRRAQQLQVLAGDYYSSYFYKLLAAHADFEAIALFSEAVIQINEEKTEHAQVTTSTRVFLALIECVYERHQREFWYFVFDLVDAIEREARDVLQKLQTDKRWETFREQWFLMLNTFPVCIQDDFKKWIDVKPVTHLS